MSEGKNGRKSNVFTPPWWLTNSHIQSCFGVFFQPNMKDEATWEEFRLPDGDFVDLCWTGDDSNPIVVLLHGLEGDVYSHYMQIMMETLPKHGWCVAAYHFRSCSGRINRLPRSYHGGETRDIGHLFDALFERYPNRPIVGVGFSLGGNVLLRYLSENPQSPLRAAVAVSVPYQLDRTIAHLPTFYKWRFLRTMKLKTMDKIHAGYDMPGNLEVVDKISSFTEFDNTFTAPLHGFKDAQDYYDRTSSRPILGAVRHPCLVLHASDDPFIPLDTIPDKKELGPNMSFELTEKGGHIGFYQGDYPWSTYNLLEHRIPDFLERYRKD